MIYQLTKRGGEHPDFCEDFTCYFSIKEGLEVCAVLDGCSSGKDSHFASALVGKLLRHCISASPMIRQELSLKEVQHILIHSLATSLYRIQKLLSLSTEELLTTIIMAVVDTSNKRAEVCVIGDGVVVADSQVFPIQQDNMPDYLAYHLKEITNSESDFQNWYTQHTTQFEIPYFSSLAIATDGVLSFTKPYVEEKSIDPVPYLLIDTELSHLKGMLTRKVNILQNTYKCHHADDLGIIRIIMD